MDKVLLKRLEDGYPDQTFAFCWDVEHWVSGMFTNHSHQRQRGITYRTYFNKPELHLQYLNKFFNHKDYMRVNGKPVLIIYECDFKNILTTEFQDHLKFLKDNYKDGLHVIQAYQSNYRNTYEWADGLIEFTPNMDHNIGHLSVAREFPDSHIKSVSRGMLTHFDNTPRYPFGFSKNAFPKSETMNVTLFGDMLLKKMCYASCFDESGPLNLVSIFAWNEWGEGAVMEPSSLYRFQILEMIQKVRDQYVMKYKCKIGSDICHEHQNMAQYI